MKKFVSCVLMLAMFLSLALFGGWGGKAFAGLPEDRIGSYVLTELIMEGEDYTELLKSANIEFTLELNADGTGRLAEGEDVLELTWDDKNVYDDLGVAVPYTFDNGILILTEDDMIMTFKKVDEELSKEPGEPIEESIVDTWVGTLELKPFLVEEVPELEELLDSAPASVNLEMREDGTYTLTLDATIMLPNLKTALYAYLEQMCKEKGLTVAELEEQAGKSLDELIEEALQEMDLSELNQSLDGVYEENNGQVTWDPGAGETKGLFTGDTLIFSVEGFGEVMLTRGSIYGKWVAGLKLLDFLGEEDEELKALLGDMEMQVVLELRSDETFTMSMDAEEIMPALRLALRSYLETSLAESGIDAETLFAMTGQSLDDLLDDALAESMDSSEMSYAISGTYKVEGQEIVLTAENNNDTKGTLKGSSLAFDVEDFGELTFKHTVNEDVLAKSEGVMSYAEYVAAELDSEVVIEAYVMDHQSWWDDSITVYAQDGEGAYFIYNMACSEKDAELLVPGQKIRVTGYKSEWSGEIEITDATFEFVKGSYSFRPEDVTELLGTDELIEKQNRLVSVKGAEVAASDGGAAFLYGWDGSGSDGSDLYFQVKVDGETYTFVVESYLRGPGTEVYEAVKELQVGDTVNLTGYLYWYEGPQPHVIGITVK